MLQKMRYCAKAKENDFEIPTVDLEKYTSIK